MRIAILALQGAFIEHSKMLAQLGVESFEVRQAADWEQPKDALIIPGGESTTMLKLLCELNLLAPIKQAIEDGLPVFGTCAGLILLAKHVVGDVLQRHIDDGYHRLPQRIRTSAGQLLYRKQREGHRSCRANDLYPRTLHYQCGQGCGGIGRG